MRIKLSRESTQALLDDPWLTDRERQVVRLYYVNGWRIEDIAAEIDCSRSTVQRILASARRKMIAK